MYLRSLRIQNLKLIRDLTLDFTRDGEPRMWTVLLAENGLCKSTLLQSIGLVASGRTRANQLANVPSLPDRRNPKGTGRIEAEFAFGAHWSAQREYPGLDDRTCAGLTSVLEIRPGSSVFTGHSTYQDEQTNIDPVEEARAVNQRHWFTAGYGVSRALPDPKSSPPITDPALQRMQPLFDAGPIAGTDFIDFLGARRKHGKTLALGFARELNNVLLGSDGILPRIRNFERRGHGGAKTAERMIQSHRFSFDSGGHRPVKVPATWLSQGYQATIAWLADLLGQGWWDAMDWIDEHPSGLGPSDIEGLVLIDELDMHLHPRWQAGFVSALKDTFPRVQFVVTTHSPMLLPGLEADEIVRLTLNEKGNIALQPSSESPKLMTGSELYDSYFGIDRLHPNDLGDASLRYSLLASNPFRSDAEDAEAHRLRQVLADAGQDPGWAPTEREQPGEPAP